MKEIYQWLEEHHIVYQKYDHEAVYTVDEADTQTAHIDGMSAKTLLVFGEKTGNFYLVSLEGHKKMEQKRIKELLGERVRFSTPKDLKRILRVTPGSVSPLGLIFDTKQEIHTYMIDKDITEADFVTWHPNNNTQTLQMTQEMNQKFLQTITHKQIAY